MFDVSCELIQKGHAHALKTQLCFLSWYQREIFLNTYGLELLKQCILHKQTACARKLLYEWSINRETRQLLVDLLIASAKSFMSWSLITTFVHCGGIHLCARNSNGDTFLHALADCPSHWKIKLIVQRVIDMFPAVVFIQNSKGETALARFCSIGDYGAVKRLIVAGSEIDDNALRAAEHKRHIFEELLRKRT